MTTYKVADGFNVALVSLNTIAPQPSTEGIKATRRTFAASGAVLDEGKYIEFEFGIVGTVTAYQALLDLFGVKTALTNDVTVYVRDEVFSWVRMNGTAVRPEPGKDVQWRSFFPRNITILVRNLAVAS